MDELVTSLKRPYINKGVPATVAETYTTNALVTALKGNAGSTKDRVIMVAGN